MNGDRLLSIETRQLWAITYHVLLHYDCAIMFKDIKAAPQSEDDNRIQFFVPYGHEHDEVVEFLKEVTRDFEVQGEMVSEKNVVDGQTKKPVHYFARGTSVEIYRSSPPDIYCDAALRQGMAQSYQKFVVQSWTVPAGTKAN